ncbi:MULTISPECIES: hypothetical protein [Deefgea]|uniref:Transporter n=1 Tax=Deefgea chitinilytica TaxID=570276 RepID=A0ABS2C8B7_9NEIS|nr:MULTISPECIES: hypothetical protein [Deefgea]MBM5570390.1 hypothetical protein [Deefgea chitinilytica]MBM9887619.1 hypothetical protein [Deefgea sp. CFH1-16]
MKKIAVLSAALACSTLASANDVVWNLNVTPIYSQKTDLDSGGRVGSNMVLASLGASTAIDRNQRIGFNLNLSRQEWEFDAPKAWGGKTPFGDFNRAVLTVPYSYGTQSGWIYSVSPGVEFSAEEGADRNESINYGLTAFAARQFSPDLMLGLGVGAWDGPIDAKVFPFLIVNWKVSDSLTVKNPNVAGPAGPAGLELAWSASPKWTLSAGGTWREVEIRLSDSNPIASHGSVENRTVPLFVSADYEISPSASLKFYAGAALNGQFIINDHNGNEVSKEKYSTMPFYAVTLSGKF